MCNIYYCSYNLHFVQNTISVYSRNIVDAPSIDYYLITQSLPNFASETIIMLTCFKNEFRLCYVISQCKLLRLLVTLHTEYAKVNRLLATSTAPAVQFGTAEDIRVV